MMFSREFDIVSGVYLFGYLPRLRLVTFQLSPQWCILPLELQHPAGQVNAAQQPHKSYGNFNQQDKNQQDYTSVYLHNASSRVCC